MSNIINYIKLESIEIALIAKDITTYSDDVIVKKNKKLKLEEELSELSSSYTSDDTQVELNAIKLYDGISRVWVDDDVLITGIKATYLSNSEN